MAVVAALLGSSAAAAASTLVVGSPLTASFALAPMCTPLCTAADTVLPEPGANITAPVGGTIVRWHILDASSGEFQLRVLSPTGGGEYTAVGSTTFELPTSEALQTFTADLPIQAGDLVGLDNSDTEAKIGVMDNLAAQASVWKPPLAKGATGASPAQVPAEAAFNAEVETPTIAEPPTVAEAHCLVPKLKGKKLKPAKKKLRASGCKLGKVKKKKGATAKTGKVVRQSAKAGSVLAAGSKVTVTLKP